MQKKAELLKLDLYNRVNNLQCRSIYGFSTFSQNIVNIGVCFFMLALVTGVWKYSLMTQSEKGQSRYYVDIAHRSSFLYAYAALLLAVFAYLSQFPEWLNTLAVVGSVFFYLAAVLGYVYQGIINKTSNQIRASIRKEPSSTPMWLTHLFTFSLILAEIGGALILGVGAMLAIWV